MPENQSAQTVCEALFLTLSFCDPDGSPGAPGNIVLFVKNGAVSEHGEALLEKLGKTPHLMLLGALQLLRSEKTAEGEIPVYFAPGMLEHSLDLPQDMRFTEKKAIEEVACAAQAILARESLCVARMPPIAHWGDTLRQNLGAELMKRIQGHARERERLTLEEEARGADGATAGAGGKSGNRGAPRI